MSQPIFTPEVFQQAIDESVKLIASILTETAKQMWSLYWQYILIFILFTALVKVLTGKIGSLIYNIIYFGILFVIIVMRGFEILLDPYFDFICLLLYVVSYYLTGRILKKVKPKRYN